MVFLLTVCVCAWMIVCNVPTRFGIVIDDDYHRESWELGCFVLNGGPYAHVERKGNADLLLCFATFDNLSTCWELLFYLAEITDDTTSTFDTECLRTESGDDYVGHTSHTVFGIPCQRWSDNSPHAHDYYDVTWFADYVTNPDAVITDIANYCRNPTILTSSSYAKPWCFTVNQDLEYEHCDIPRCKSKCSICVIYSPCVASRGSELHEA